MNETSTASHDPGEYQTAPAKAGLWRNWKMWITLSLVPLGIWAVRPSAGKAKAEEAADDASCSVGAARVLRADLSTEEVIEAEFRPYQEIELHAKVSGFLESLTVDVGDRVTNGQLLATLEIPELKDDLERADSLEKRNEEEVKKAEAEYEEAHLASTRLAAAYAAKPNLVPQQEVDLAQAKDHAAEAAVATARQQTHVAKAEMKKLRTMLNYCRICAAFDGVITRRFTDPGALIHDGGSSSTPLVRLSENDKLRLVFPAPISVVPFIKIGDPVGIRVQKSSEKIISGQVSRFTRKIEASTRKMDVEVDVPNADLSLVPGMYAWVTLKVEQRPHTLVVPVEAVAREGTATVYLIDGQSKIEERPVKVGMETPDKLEILDGLKENDLVMIGNRSQVKPGQKVQPKTIQ